MNTTTHSVTVPTIGQVNVTVSERGKGRPVLILHGGGGPMSVAGFSGLLSETQNARVLTPVHPGFAGTPRPDGLKSPADLAALYVALLDQLDLRDVTVVGNSIGGWIASEIALLASPRVRSVVLVNAVGIVVEGHPIADPFTLTLPELMQRSYYNPEPFRIDPKTMTDVQRAGMAANRAALAIYGGQPCVGDSTLRARLGNVNVPVLVLWGEADRVVDADYGRAFASAIPGARFELLAKTGHVPQIETPDQLLKPLWAFADANAANRPV